MKRIAIFILLNIYFLSNFGMVVNTHFCGGQLISASFIGMSHNSGCGSCGKQKAKSDCCKDKQTKLSAEDSHQIINHAFPNFSSSIGLIQETVFLFKNDYALLNKNEIQFYTFKNGPPKTPIYLQFRSLLI